MSQNCGGRPRGSTNQPGHSAGGTRPGAGRNATAHSASQKAPAPSSMQASRSTGTDPQIALLSMFIFHFYSDFVLNHHM